MDHLNQQPEPDPSLRNDGPQAIVDHLTQCRPVDAAIVVDGNADGIIERLIADGWTWTEGRAAEYVAGKRIRYLTPPQRLADEQILRALAGDDDHGGW